MDLNFTTECDGIEQYLIESGALTVGLLQDDGWVSRNAAEEFIASLGVPCEQADIDVLNGK